MFLLKEKNIQKKLVSTISFKRHRWGFVEMWNVCSCVVLWKLPEALIFLVLGTPWEGGTQELRIVVSVVFSLTKCSFNAVLFTKVSS